MKKYGATAIHRHIFSFHPISLSPFVGLPHIYLAGADEEEREMNGGRERAPAPSSSGGMDPNPNSEGTAVSYTSPRHPYAVSSLSYIPASDELVDLPVDRSPDPSLSAAYKDFVKPQRCLPEPDSALMKSLSLDANDGSCGGGGRDDSAYFNPSAVVVADSPLRSSTAARGPTIPLNVEPELQMSHESPRRQGSTSPRSASVMSPISGLLPRPTTCSNLPTYKILLVGDAGVGKSQLLSRFANNVFDLNSKATIGVEFVSREVEVPTERTGELERVNIQLWDTAGQERCNSISSTYFRRAHGVAIVYDITRKETLLNVPRWMAHLKKFTEEECVVVVIGNKTDLRNLKDVTEEEAEEVVHSLGVRHFYASALTGDGVPAAFLHLLLSVNALSRSVAVASQNQNFVGRVGVGESEQQLLRAAAASESKRRGSCGC